MVSPVTLPLLHVASTSKLPRALIPLKLPLAHASGSDGNTSMYPPWLCSSISVIPAVDPKLPSIWNGGWVSNRLGRVDSFKISCTILCERLPSCNRAQKLIFHALLQPVPPSPRVFSVTRIASAYRSSPGLLPTTILLPGCSQCRWFTCRCLLSPVISINSS